MRELKAQGLLRKWAEGFGVRRQDAALSSFKAVPWHRTPGRFAHQSGDTGSSCAWMRAGAWRNLLVFQSSIVNLQSSISLWGFIVQLSLDDLIREFVYVIRSMRKVECECIP